MGYPGELAMNTSSHISLETLADIVEDRASTETRTSAMAHLATCSVCDDSLRRLQFLILMMKSDRSADVPRDVLISAIKILSSETKPPLRSIIATLIFDSRNTGPAFGMRSLHKASRQLLYSAQQTDLDLRITIQNEECVVAGQVIRDDDGERGGGRVEISGPTGSAEASLNELCEFTLPAIPVGSYSLRVKMVDVEIEIPELELKD
jgi:hypothetical protein